MKRIKWGIIGSGKIASKFASEFRYVSHAEVHAIASRTLSKAEAFASTFNIKKAYGSYKELLEDPRIDAVYIATPHSLHFVNTIEALNHRKAVLCEKPMGMDLREVSAMIDKARKHKVLLMEGLWTAFLPHYEYVVKQIKSGQLGTLKALKADFGFKIPSDPETRLMKKSLGGGSLLDIGIYPIFLAYSLLGKPLEIKAKADFFDTGADSSCEMEFHYDKGVVASLYSSFKENTPTEAILVFERGSIKVKGRFHEPSFLILSKDGKEESIEFPVKGLGYSYEINHFNELLRNKFLESPIVNFETSIDLITLLDRVREKIGLYYK